MIALAAEDLADLRRWALSAVVVVAVYGGAAAAMIAWHEPVDMDEPAAAIVIEFAPLLVGPTMQQTELPPGPDMVMSDASPKRESPEDKEKDVVEQKIEAKLEQKTEEKIESQPVEEPPPEVPAAPNPEVAVAPPPPKQEVKQETPQRQEPRPPAPATTAPSFVPDQTAAIPAAPLQGKPDVNKSNAVQTWQKQIFALLARTLRYPTTAERRGQTGIAQVAFSLDRQGRVYEPRIVRSSGVAVLDEEALALLQRAQPFPPPPAREFPGERVSLSVPVRFLPPGASTDARR
jgi:periplasmic protein TonB